MGRGVEDDQAHGILDVEPARMRHRAVPLSDSDPTLFPHTGTSGTRLIASKLEKTAPLYSPAIHLAPRTMAQIAALSAASTRAAARKPIRSNSPSSSI